jgi:hypothetical protein
MVRPQHLLWGLSQKKTLLLIIILSLVLTVVMSVVNGWAATKNTPFLEQLTASGSTKCF